jgi:squalene-hopene/tetraprenyl-beta-curcumene cyclase
MSLHAVFERRRAARLVPTAARVSVSVPPAGGFWTQDLASSPSATAAALCALVVAEQHIDEAHEKGSARGDSWAPGSLFRGEFMQLVVQNLQWLAERQNADGGWGEADGSPSTLAATLLVEAAFQVTGVPAKSAALLDRAEGFVQQSGGVAAFHRQHRNDPALTASVLASCALADLASWRRVPSWSWGRIAALVRRSRSVTRAQEAGAAPLLATGIAKFRHAKPLNPLRRLALGAAQKPALAALEALQGVSGGFMESIAQTSFVVMCLAGAGLHEHPVVRRGVAFLLSTVNGDGGWPTRRATS